MRTMAETDKWTLKHFSEELNVTLNNWRTKIPGLSTMPQVTQAKEMKKIIEAMIDEVGSESTAWDLSDLSRTEKVSNLV